MKLTTYQIEHTVTVLDKQGRVHAKYPTRRNLVTDAGLLELRNTPTAAIGRYIRLGTAAEPLPTYLPSGSITATVTGTTVVATSDIFTSEHATNKNEIVFSDGSRARIAAYIGARTVGIATALAVNGLSFRIELGERSNLTASAFVSNSVIPGAANNYSVFSTRGANYTAMHTRTFSVQVASGLPGDDVSITEVGLSSDVDNALSAIWVIPYGPILVPDGGTFIDRVGITESTHAASFISASPFAGLAVAAEAGVVPLLCGEGYCSTVAADGGVDAAPEYTTAVSSAYASPADEAALRILIDADPSLDFTKQAPLGGTSFMAVPTVDYDAVDSPYQVSYRATIPSSSFPDGWRSIGLYDSVNETWLFRARLASTPVIAAGKVLHIAFTKKWGRV